MRPGEELPVSLTDPETYRAHLVCNWPVVVRRDPTFMDEG